MRTEEIIERLRRIRHAAALELEKVFVLVALLPITNTEEHHRVRAHSVECLRSWILVMECRRRGQVVDSDVDFLPATLVRRYFHRRLLAGRHISSRRLSAGQPPPSGGGPAAWSQFW